MARKQTINPDEALKLYNEGKTVSEIAAIFYVHRQTVYHALRKNGCRFRGNDKSKPVRNLESLIRHSGGRLKLKSPEQLRAYAKWKRSPQGQAEAIANNIQNWSESFHEPPAPRKARMPRIKL